MPNVYAYWLHSREQEICKVPCLVQVSGDSANSSTYNFTTPPALGSYPLRMGNLLLPMEKHTKPQCWRISTVSVSKIERGRFQSFNLESLHAGVFADVGQTYNSSDTMMRLLASNPEILAFMGDWRCSPPHLLAVLVVC